MRLNLNQKCYIYLNFDTSDFFPFQLLPSYIVDILVFGQNSRSWVTLLNF